MQSSSEKSVPADESVTTEELRNKLQELGRSIKGSKAVLAVRLRKAMQNAEKTKSGEETTTDVGNDDGDEEDFDALSKDEVKTRLRALGLEVTGKKAELVGRLKAAYEDDDDDDDEDDEDEDDNEDDEKDEEEGKVVEHSRRNDVGNRKHYRDAGFSRNVLTFKDVEDALETFSGDGSENIHRWFVMFEETAEMCDWSETQKVIYCKRLLKGSAKLFVNFECHAKTWTKLRKELVKEFSNTVNSKQVHDQLSKVKKKHDESYQAYVYRVLEMASHAEIELEAKIQYIIDGIQDDEVSKTILYTASTVKELRKKLNQYETLKNNSRLKTNARIQKYEKTKRPPQAQSDEKPKHCFNCGSKTHISLYCPHKVKGPKCFGCGEFGHVSLKCTKSHGANKERKEGTDKPRCDLLASTDKKTYKKVKILNKEVTAVLDGGSDLHLVRSSFYVQLGAPPLERKTISFDGVGTVNRRTLGRFRAEVVIDGLSFDFNFDVVPDDFLGHDMLVGGELSDYVEVRTKHRQATLVKLESEEAQLEEGGWKVLAINAYEEPEDERNVEIQHIADPEIKSEVKEIIRHYTPTHTKHTGVEMRIVLQDDAPVFQNPRRLSAEQKKQVNGIIDKWMDDGIVRPSVSDFASPIVLVTKKNGQPRLCVDYRALNKKIIKDRNPLPLIEDQLDRLQDARLFSTLDLRDGFLHVPVEEDSVKYTAFVVPDGHYEFLKVPFGLCNSPAVFQRHIRAVFRPLITNGVVLVYLDDLIIPSKDEREGLEKLKTVLQTASQFGLEINWTKCELLVDKVEYLGYIVEAGQIQPSPKKTLAVSKFPLPRTIKQVQSFLGLTGYFRKFIPQFSVRARPLSQLLKNGAKFDFGTEQQLAFDSLKSALTEEPVLKLYRVGAETELHTDACMGGLGAVLLQKDSEGGKLHPVYYASWKTTPAEERYTSYELEILAVVKALKKFRVYLLDVKFKIVTDCKAFVLTMKKKDLCLRVSHWALLIDQFDYTIEHRPGASMRHVDALSRNPVEVFLLQEGRDGLIETIQKAQQDDPELKKTIDAVQAGRNTDFSMSKRGILYREDSGVDLMVIPKTMQYDVIKQAHEQGHFGWKKIEFALKREFWFPNMRQKIQKVIGNCVKCLLAERKYGKSDGLLNPIEKGTTPLDTYHVDHLGPMPSTRKAYNHLLVVVDAFTKFVWIYPTKSTTANEVVDKLKKQATVFGNPKRIISDRGTAFTANVFKEYCATENIEHVLITTGIPRGNGQVERMNRVIIPMLTKMAISNPMEWWKHVDQVQQFMNSTFSRSTQMTPFELMIGEKMRLKDDQQLRELIEEEFVKVYEEKRTNLRDEARKNILNIQRENKKTYDRKRKPAGKFKVDDLVAIQRTQFGGGAKLHPKFLGPYKVTSAMRNDRYIVEKVGDHEGPNKTSSAADLMKPWTRLADLNEVFNNSDEDNALEADDHLED